MFRRRKWWIVVPFLVSLVISYGVYHRLPKIYKATTLILVQPQEVPEDYIKPTVTSLVSDRLSTLSQQILSRTHLEKVIKEFNLFHGEIGKAPMEEILEAMRKSIGIQIQQTQNRDVQNTFTISYAGKDPKKVMMVTNRLASLFIEENLRAREKQAAVTSDFIERELFAIEGALKEKEKETRNFKERHMGELPEQLDANLRILERLQDQLNNNSDALKTAEARGLMVREQISEFSNQGLSIG
ncbi:MAG: protein GumC, partial [candidate division Zixibacteria bacterium]|nr:protein GumC [candidate division Zixibacteria bacterium]